MTKIEIIAGHYSCTCHDIYKLRDMADPSCVLCEHGGEIELIMDEWAKEVATKALLQQGYDDNAANKIVEEILKSNQ